MGLTSLCPADGMVVTGLIQEIDESDDGLSEVTSAVAGHNKDGKFLWKHRSEAMTLLTSDC